MPSFEPAPSLIRRALKIATGAKTGGGRALYTGDCLMDCLVLEVSLLVYTEFRACLR